MNSTEFTELRKKLDKTQKELAILLGISLKAVCSYEQGWRTIPTHVERQLLFLHAKKNQKAEDNRACWEIRDCPQEKRELCPAWEFNSGEYCWFINGTICDCAPQDTWEDKIEICKRCVVFKPLA